MPFLLNRDQDNCVESENRVISHQCGQSLNTPNGCLSSGEIISNNYVQKKENIQSPGTELRCLWRTKSRWEHDIQQHPVNRWKHTSRGSFWSRVLTSRHALFTVLRDAIAFRDWRLMAETPLAAYWPEPTTSKHNTSSLSRRSWASRYIRRGRPGQEFYIAAQYSHSHLSWSYIERDPNVCSAEKAASSHSGTESSNDIYYLRWRNNLKIGKENTAYSLNQLVCTKITRLIDDF